MRGLVLEESTFLLELRSLAGRGLHGEVLERLATLPPDELARRTPFALLAAEAHGRLGAHAEAERWAVAARDAARQRGERHAELRALSVQGAIALERGDGDAAMQHISAALDVAREVGDHTAQARCLNNLGIIAQLHGEPEHALATYKLALAAYQQAGLLRGMAETHHNIAISLRNLGDHVSALRAADEAVRIAGGAGDEALAALTLAGRAELHLLLGDVELAAVELSRASPVAERVHDHAGLVETWRLQAGVARVRGRDDEAVALLERAAVLGREHGNANTLADIERDLGAVLAARGDAAGARAARERAIALLRRLGAKKAASELAALIA